MNKRITFTVTTDLNFDQRMIRICTSLHKAGFDVTLVGLERPFSKPLLDKPYKQKRLSSWFYSGKLFYVEANIRHFLNLLFSAQDAICSIDLDTILAGHFASKIKGNILVYDAHEYFTGMEEVVSRPKIQKVWKRIERFTLPKIEHAYTIGSHYAKLFEDEYGLHCSIVRNIAVLQDEPPTVDAEDFILYQGAINKGRALQETISAAADAGIPLKLAGLGNMYDELQPAVEEIQAIQLLGYIEPEQLRKLTPKAVAGLTIFENQGISNYYSLANRFFDYIHAGIPQIAMAYPEYVEFNKNFEVALLIPDTKKETIMLAMKRLFSDKELATRLRNNARAARLEYNWQNEEKILIQFWKKVLELS